MSQQPGLVEKRGPEHFEFLEDGHQSRFDKFLLMISLDGWRVNNSPMSDYSRRANIGGTPSGLMDVIRERVGFSEDNVGLDLAAGSKVQALQDLLESGVLGKALATNYHDRRGWSAIRNRQLDHVSGNLTHRRTWRKIHGWQRDHAPEGFALAMHRPVGGLQDLSPEVYSGAGHAVLDMVRPGGLMFTQVPRRLTRLPDELEELCASIHERPDVEEVITTAPRSPRWTLPLDDRDTYAVIIKR